MRNLMATLIASAAAAGAFGQVQARPERPEAITLMSVVPGAAIGKTSTVSLDREYLRAMQPDDAFVLDLHEGRFRGLVQRVERRSDSSDTVFATLSDDPDARIILTRVNDAIAGTIRSPGTRTSLFVHSGPDGSLIVEPIDPGPDVECTTDGSGRRFPSPAQDTRGEPVGREAGAVQRGGAFCGGTPTVIYDVLVVYTTAARLEAGSTDDMLAEVQLAVDTTNQAYEDSFQGLRARLVFTYESGYGETSDHEIDRDALADPDDMVLDNAHGFRDLYGADYVVLIVGDVASGCGIAFCTPDGSNEGFAVVKRSCASSNWTFAHEIGHLQGLAHNREDAGFGCNNDCYSYGHRFTGDDGVGYRTVMAYDNDDNDFERIGIFSNPNVFWQGVACGELFGNCDDDEFNVLTISNTGFNRENWRNSKFSVWVDFNYAGTERGSFVNPWSTMTAGQDAIFDGVAPPYRRPELLLAGGTTSETLTLSKPMTIRACDTAIIGQ